MMSDQDVGVCGVLQVLRYEWTAGIGGVGFGKGEYIRPSRLCKGIDEVWEMIVVQFNVAYVRRVLFDEVLVRG